MFATGRPTNLVLTIACTLLAPAVVWACPFCSVVSQTFTEEINTVQVGVIAQLVEAPPKPDPNKPLDPSANVEKTKFEIVQVLKGADVLKDKKEIMVLYFGQQPKGTKFLILGIDPPDVAWNAPVPLTDKAVEYVGKLLSLPEKGADRLVFFQDYLEHPDELLARDAYDEFAKAPYSEVKDLKDRMQHDKLVGWIQDKNVLASRRRLYLTMLGVCGTEQDADMLEELITREEPAGEPKQALDAMIACYLTLKGPAGMPLIEVTFLKNAKSEYTETYSAIMALRFHGQEETIIPKERLVVGLRHMLDRPQLADLVIPDLARWQDWQSMGKLVTLFKESDDKTSWVRVPVVQFLKACPLPEAQQHIAELEKIDPESVKRASFFVPLGGGAAPAQPPAAVPPPVDAVKGPKTTPVEGAVSSAAGEPVPPKPVAGNDPHEPIKQPEEKKDEKKDGKVASATPAGNDGPQSPTQNTKTPSEPTNPRWLAFVPLAVGLALLLLLGLIVRGGVGRVPTEAKS